MYLINLIISRSVIYSVVLCWLKILSLISQPSSYFASADNWAIIVSTSRYFFNYRHAANAVAVYDIVRSVGLPDSHIILMDATDINSDRRNPNRGFIHFDNHDQWGPLPTDEVEADYRGDEVTAASFLNLLKGRTSNTGMHQQLRSDSNSSVLLYMTGHGGDEFLKFHDNEELTAMDLADAFEEMHLKRRYKELLFIIDTCQAATMANYITSPNIITLASSLRDENSYAFDQNPALGVAVIDRFTYSMYKFFRIHMDKKSLRRVSSKYEQLTLIDLFKYFDRNFLYSTATILRSTEGTRNPSMILLTDFFSSSSYNESFEVIDYSSRASIRTEGYEGDDFYEEWWSRLSNNF